ncbi:MAG: hypothetical protein ABII79_09050 [bacterium]
MNNVSVRFRWLFGVIILFLGIILIWGVRQQKGTVSQLTPIVGGKINPTSPVVIKGIFYQELEEGKPGYSLRADEFKIHPRAFGIFTIQPIKEAILVDAIIGVYLSSARDNLTQPTQKVALFPSLFGYEAKKDGTKGIITRGVINNLHINIYKDQKLFIEVTAVEAIISFRKKEAVLKEARIEHKASRKFINAKRIVWDSEEQKFKVPGEYIAVTPKGTAKGYGIKVNLDFKVEKMSSWEHREQKILIR